jgi:small subunit ribosomal protein S9
VTEPETPTNETANTPEPPASDASPAPERAAAAPAVESAPMVEPPAAAQAEELLEVPAPPVSGVYWGTGRRKSAVARVRLTPGEGKILINKRGVDEYFTEPQEQLAVRESLLATNTEKSFDVFVNVCGGGHAGQAGAIRLGIARALVRANEGYEAALRDRNYLTRDARVVERKKYGQRKARRRFQFSKR